MCRISGEPWVESADRDEVVRQHDGDESRPAAPSAIGGERSRENKPLRDAPLVFVVALLAPSRRYEVSSDRAARRPQGGRRMYSKAIGSRPISAVSACPGCLWQLSVVLAQLLAGTCGNGR